MSPMDIFKKFLESFDNIDIYESNKENIDILDKKVYLVNNKLKELVEITKKKPYSYGTYLGEVKEKRFAPTFTLLDMFKKTNQYICVNKKAAWLYLCKRDVLKDSIIIKRGLIEDEVKMKKLKDHGLFLIKDEENKTLGLGKVKFVKSAWFVKNILDRGNYLRKEN